MVKAIVGSGGKTTLLHRMAKAYRAEGKRVFVTTTTHMFREPDTLLTDDPAVIAGELMEKGYAMAGLPAGEKIGPLSPETYKRVCRFADVVLVEADGSKHMPLKFPGPNEPVIPDNVDEIYVVYGLQGIGHRADRVCHRLELVKQCLGIRGDTPITREHAETLVQKGYLEPLMKRYPGIPITVVPMNLPYKENDHI